MSRGGIRGYGWQDASIAIVTVFCGFVLFHFFGSPIRGFRTSESLFDWWVSGWLSPESDTGHGPVILVLAVWILHRNLKGSRWKEGEKAPVQGLVLIVGALGLHLIGYYLQHPRISIFAFLVYVGGGAFILGGRRWGAAILFPCLLMLFSIRWRIITDELGFPMRLAVIKASYELAQGIGIEVIRNGTLLHSPDGSYQYDVAPACSGIRSLIALSSLSLVLGYLSFKSWWRRILLLGLAFPFAYVGNVIRVFAIILAAEWFGQKAGTVVHEWFGFLIFVIVLGLAILTVRLLHRCLPEAEGSEGGPMVKGLLNWDFGPVPILGSRLFVALLVIGTAALTAWMTRRADTLIRSGECGIILRANQIDPIPLPTMLSIDWAGRDVGISEVERRVLPADTGYSRTNYVHLLNPDRQVFFSVVLSGRDRSSIHRPEVCLVGQGWTIEERFRHDFEVPGLQGGKLRTSVLRIERSQKNDDGEEKPIEGLFAYWFVGGDSVAATNAERMATMIKDRLFRLTNHRWAYIVAQTLSPDGEEAGLQRLEEVIAQVVPRFQAVGFSAE